MRLVPDPHASQDDTATAGPSLASRLAEPLSSISQLLDFLVPPLVSLNLLPEQPSLANHYRITPTPLDPGRFLRRQLGLVQKILVEQVWPDWESALQAEEGPAGVQVLERWFVPPSNHNGASRTTSDDTSAKVALSAYAVLSSLLSIKSASTLRPRSLEIVSQLLVELSSTFNIEEIYLSTVGSSPVRPPPAEEDSDDDDTVDPASLSLWEQSLRDLINVPARVANAWGAIREKQRLPTGRVGEGVPAELEINSYVSTLTISYLSLLWTLSSDSNLPVFRSALSLPLTHLIPMPSFLPTALPILIPHLLPPTSFPTPANELLQRQRHVELLRAVLAELSEPDLTRLLRSLLSTLVEPRRNAAEATPAQRARGAAFVLDRIFGPLQPSTSSVWKVAVELLLDRNYGWDAKLIPRIVCAWVGEDEQGRVEILKAVVGAWGAKEEIRAGTEARRTYLTSLLLDFVVSLPPLHPDVVDLSRSPAFLSAVSAHLTLISPTQRLLGMLVAEVVSGRTVDPASGVQPLNFGDEIWAGETAEKVLVRMLREEIEEVESGEGKQAEGWQDWLRRVYSSTPQPAPAARPRPVKVNQTPIHPTSVEEAPSAPPKRPLISIIDSDGSDSDSDLQPYPLPGGPSKATLEALSSDDPSLYQSAYPSSSSTNPASQTRKRGKLRPPVYVPELVAYLKGEDPEGGKEEADAQAERVEIGLREGAALIRRKAGWGGELKENAVNLAFAVMSLQDQYEIDNFDQLKQDILVALIASCPVEVAPAVIEQYFAPSYSITQRHTLLASLALAARELAKLPIPSAHGVPSKSISQPPQFPSKQLPPALHRRLLGSQQSTGPLEAMTADLTSMALSEAREDAETTIPQAAREKLLSVRRFNSRPSGSAQAQAATTTPTFTTLAAEFFILPLINRFWLYLRDTATSSLYRTSSSASSVGPYAGGASASALLEPLLLSKYFATLAVLLHAARHSPSFLAVLVPDALALVLALRPPASSSSSTTSLVDEDDDAHGGMDAALVLSAQLELILVLVDATVQLDGGRTLMSSSAVSGGSNLVAEAKAWAEEVFEAEERKGGEMGIGRAGRAAAGVLLRIEEILGRWRGAVGW
ncbi:hypothetical protein JCM5296_005508 [Sporobolomyces johnsonii]